MFRTALRPFASSPCHRTRSAAAYTARYFHQVTAEFINYDTSGKLVSKKVSAMMGDQGAAYIMADPVIGFAFRAASPFASPSASAASTEYRGVTNVKEPAL
ncbi:uncharacterized protein DSM5745_07276 [Aspergillus mulundensis]|uniref:Uncharacterized protein n=1 Tax=Aspergillus mulundensis TaxID=1810919 RepID=A0A3D8RL29_9EURO|nr:hypothetical protein DSM5745_07276 [Aspergillus mulundensis]RDW74614.1 hypothetical protein DSM5745_07276 [Aspergillus mulundensis]